MSTRFSIALVLAGMVSSVLFGIGAITVLSIPTLSQHATLLLPLVIVASFILAPAIGWIIAPRLRSQWLRKRNV